MDGLTLEDFAAKVARAAGITVTRALRHCSASEAQAVLELAISAAHEGFTSTYDPQVQPLGVWFLAYLTTAKKAVRANGPVAEPEPVVPAPLERAFNGMDLTDGKDERFERREVERFELPPAPGDDCPACFSCTWWEFTPPRRPQLRLQITDPEVSEAQRATYARKVAISRRVLG